MRRPSCNFQMALLSVTKFSRDVKSSKTFTPIAAIPRNTRRAVRHGLWVLFFDVVIVLVVWLLRTLLFLCVLFSCVFKDLGIPSSLYSCTTTIEGGQCNCGLSQEKWVDGERTNNRIALLVLCLEDFQIYCSRHVGLCVART